MNGGSRNPIAQVERTESSVLVNADPDGEFGTNTASAPTSLIPGLLYRFLEPLWVQLQWTWDQAGMGRALCVDPDAWSKVFDVWV